MKRMGEWKKRPVHLVVYFAGKCPKCNRYNEREVYDYGKLTYEELDEKLDETDHPVEPLLCPCGDVYAPEFAVYRDRIRGFEEKRRLSWGNEIEGETFLEMKEGQKERVAFFEQGKEAFWRDYFQDALSEWNAMVGELHKEELEKGLMAVGVSLPEKRTETRLRKEVMKLATVKEKAAFWRAANEGFVMGHLLSLGPMAWQPEEDAAKFGVRRLRSAILHFPMAEVFETLRTEAIGRIVKKERGDNAFLFRRIASLTEELVRIRRKNTEWFHQMERMKRELAEKEEKIHRLSRELERAREERVKLAGEPEGRRKIRELKSFIRELLEENRRLLSLIPEEEPKEEEEPQEEETAEEPVSLDVLSGKTLGVVGGMHQKEVEKCGVKVLFHHGDRLDPDFYRLLDASDILVVIPKLVSHAAMWQAKGYATLEDKPIFFERALNIDRLLENVARNLQKKEEG